MPKSPRYRLLLCLAVSFLLGACGGENATPSSDTGDGEPVAGGTAIFGVLGDFQAFNPVTNTHATSGDVMRYMLFTPIVQYDENFEVVPYLARSWELSDTSVVFHLRDDVFWHDGQPVTAEDVKFTFDLAKNPQTASLLGAAFISQVESATVVDPHTIRFDFVAPHSQALEDFWWSPLPSHLLEGVEPSELAQHPFNRNPTGSGPYRFVSWQPNQQLVLEANPEFPEELGGPPHLERVVFRVISEATTIVTELLTGSADAIGYTLLPQQAEQIEQQGGDRVQLRHYPSREFTYIGWNHERDLFDDARVRRAMTMAIDRPRIIEALLLGYGVPSHGMIPSWSPMYSEQEPLPYDPEAARHLLAEAGWTDRDGDGILENDRGEDFHFTLLTNTENRLRQDVATVVQDQLRQVGVAAEVRTMEFQTMLQRHKAREYDAVVSGWILDNFKVDPTPLFSCEEARTPMSANRAGYCNPQADEIAERALRTTDPDEAREIWAEYSEVLRQDQPISFLFWIEDLAGVGPRLRDVVMDQRSKLVSVDEWWIPENMQR